ncbi:MAG: 50S ribosomal protein L11 methyltransferase [Acidimicrobiia bacterium]|jgi:ribosomal protein L11 methyltransferase
MAEERVVVRVEVPTREAELAADAMWEAGASAVAEVPSGPGLVLLTAEVLDLGAVGGRWGAQAVPVDDSVLDAWRAHARPVRAGRRVVLHPAWLPIEAVAADDVVVVLDPGRAFGSGSHPATRLAVAAIEAHGPGDRVLDVGCGSGVLAVVAARLGSRHVTAVDVDPEAVRATAANAAANGVADRIDPSLGPLGEVTGAFDLVVANIGQRVLVELAPDLLALAAPGGTLVLSGLLADQVPAVVAAYPGADEVACGEEDGWAAPVLRRR